MPVAAMRAAGLGEVRRWKLHESTRNFIPLDMQILNVLFWDLRSIASSSPGLGDFASPKTKHTKSACPTGWYLLYTFRCTNGARWFYLPPTRPSLHAESYCIHTTSLPTFVSTPFFVAVEITSPRRREEICESIIELLAQTLCELQ